MNRNGFTLIELLAVSAILAITLTLALPAFKDLHLRQKINGQANQLFSIIYLARAEAIKRSTVVTVCKSGNGQTCGAQWSEGWLMFADQDADGILDPLEHIISAGLLDSQIMVSWSAFGSDNYLRLTPRGMTMSQNGTFTLCPINGNTTIARTVVVSKLARVRLPPVGRDDGGDPIVCG